MITAKIHQATTQYKPSQSMNQSFYQLTPGKFVHIQLDKFKS